MMVLLKEHLVFPGDFDMMMMMMLCCFDKSHKPETGGKDCVCLKTNLVHV